MGRVCAELPNILVYPKGNESSLFPVHCVHRSRAVKFDFLTQVFTQDAEISALFSQPIEFWEDCQLRDVVEYLLQCPNLALPAAWPDDF